MPAVERAPPLVKPTVFAGVWGTVRHACRRLGAMREAMAGRRALAQMDERMFADIGVSHSEAAFEMNRKPWDTANGKKR